MSRDPDIGGQDYGAVWDAYARSWRARYPDLGEIGDEWTGQDAGAASSVEEYVRVIEERFIAPYVTGHDTVLEIGVGGGRTAALLLKYCSRLICADVSQHMLDAARRRVGSDRASFVKLDGRSLAGIASGSVDVCFCYDTLVHLDALDVFNYLSLLPGVMRGRRICVLHHANTLSERGWRRFLHVWEAWLERGRGERPRDEFAVMTNELMEQFLSHWGYEEIVTDTTTVPRDTVRVCRAPPDQR